MLQIKNYSVPQHVELQFMSKMQFGYLKVFREYETRLNGALTHCSSHFNGLKY